MIGNPARGHEVVVVVVARPADEVGLIRGGQDAVDIAVVPRRLLAQLPPAPVARAQVLDQHPVGAVVFLVAPEGVDRAVSPLERVIAEVLQAVLPAVVAPLHEDRVLVLDAFLVLREELRVARVELGERLRPGNVHGVGNGPHWVEARAHGVGVELGAGVGEVDPQLVGEALPNRHAVHAGSGVGLRVADAADEFAFDLGRRRGDGGNVGVAQRCGRQVQREAVV